jgi:MFS family permease
MLGFSIGPLLGGALTHITGWRVIFWLNALLMLVALAGMASAGSATMRADVTRSRRADWVGFILLATFMVALIFGLHEVPDAGPAHSMRAARHCARSNGRCRSTIFQRSNFGRLWQGNLFNFFMSNK